ncbi:MAG: hypothetical protein ABIY51_00895 [Ferruginibacter sp.]
MTSHATLNISPNQVPYNTTMTVRSESGSFSDHAYQITDVKGRIIRKGSICDRINEFRLSVVGLSTGAYYFTMGTEAQKFTIVYG